MNPLRADNVIAGIQRQVTGKIQITSEVCVRDLIATACRFIYPSCNSSFLSAAVTSSAADTSTGPPPLAPPFPSEPAFPFMQCKNDCLLETCPLYSVLFAQGCETKCAESTLLYADGTALCPSLPLILYLLSPLQFYSDMI